MNLRSRFLLMSSAVLLAGVGAHGQDFYSNAAGVRSTSLGGTYVVSSSDVLGALSANPAGLTFLRGENLNLEADTFFARGSFSNSVNEGSPLKTSPAVVPYGAFGMPIGHSRFSFGIGLLPELASRGDWKYVDAPGTAGASYGLQQQKSAIVNARAVAGVGFTVNSRLSIGATFGANYNQNTLDAPYVFQTQPVLAGLKTLLAMHTDGVGWNGSVGVIAQATRSVQVGAAWKSRTVIDSTGHASGDVASQFAALGVNAPSTFAYNAAVQNVLPQSVLGDVSWQTSKHWLFAFQVDWTNWHDSFVSLPVTLTNGTNATINSLVGGTTLQDSVPLHWKDQYGFHVGAERSLTENTMVRIGYAHANDPVPGSTLTPLTAAIMQNQVTGGFAYTPGRSKWEVAYSFHPTATEHVGTSGLLAGEYDESTVKVGTQAVLVGYSFRF
ncbi:MAG TPA: outer membrane protein transport protein [Candidatus Acidoferrum sp.]|jgi:long-subunit fatty acid transport protein